MVKVMKTKLKNICIKIGSGATPRGGKEAYHGGNFALIRSQNVLDFVFSSDGLVYINDEQANKLDNVALEKGDVLLNITGDSVARACIVPEKILPARVNQHVAIIRGNNKEVLQEYILFFLQMSKDRLLQLASAGATRNALTKGMIEDLEIDLPTIEIQKKIVQVLDNICKKIDLNKEINDNLLQQALCVYGELITNKDKNGTIGKYCSVKSGFAFKSSWWIDSGIKVIKIGSINQDNLNLNDCSYVSIDKVEKASDFTVGAGDLLIAMTGATIGKFAMVPYSTDILLVNQRVGKFFLGESPVQKLPFIYCTLKQPDISNEIINRGQGSAQPNISASDIMSIPCVIPSKDIIFDFNATMQPLFDLIITNQHENQKLSEIRDNILPQLMLGELNSSNINI